MSTPTYSAPLVCYDDNPDREYHADGRRAGHSALHARPRPGPATPAPRSQPGFGNVVARRMLEAGAPPKHPWLTVDVARQELAMQEYARDRAAVALDSVE